MNADALRKSMAAIPLRPGAGRWAVGVSGGADSVALLLLLAGEPELSLHVVHLDHQTRDGESALDARFVVNLAKKLGVPCTVALRSEVESTLPSLLKNVSSRYRAARLALFRQVVETNGLSGVMLAHHADDQAETVLLRIMRGAGPANLSGMRVDSTVHGLRIYRPLLNIPSTTLREFLQQQQQPWREDASNQSDQYQRNRLRKWLREHSHIVQSLFQVEAASRSLRGWLDETAPTLGDEFAAAVLRDLPPPLARHAAARWLISHGSPAREINAKVTDRLIAMATDAASPARQDFPGGLRVRRKAGWINCVA